MWPFRKKTFPDWEYDVTLSHGEIETILVGLQFIKTVLKTGKISPRTAKTLHKKDVIPARDIGKLQSYLRRAIK